MNVGLSLPDVSALFMFDQASRLWKSAFLASPNAAQPKRARRDKGQKSKTSRSICSLCFACPR